MTQTPYTVRWWIMAGQETRRWAYYNLGAQMCAMHTGITYGPEVKR